MAEAERLICPRQTLADGGLAKRFALEVGGRTLPAFVVAYHGEVFGYVNSCPHVGLPLDPAPNRFLDAKKAHIVCSAHGARFRIEDGECFSGPCYGESLEAVPVRIDDEGRVIVPAEAGL